MFLKLSSTSTIQDAGDVIINMDKIIDVKILKLIDKDKVIFSIKIENSEAHYFEHHDKEEDARNRLREILILIGNDEVTSNDIADTFKIKDVKINDRKENLLKLKEIGDLLQEIAS